MRFKIALLLVGLNMAIASEQPSSNPSGSSQNQASFLHNCKASNLSTDPIGDVTYYEAEFGRDHTAFSIWRMPCQDGSFMPVMTVEPISRKPFVCSFNFKIEQNGRVYDDVLLLKNPKTKWSFLCGDVKYTRTVKIHQLERPYFDPDKAFTIIHKRKNHNSIEVSVPATHAEEVFSIGGQVTGVYAEAGVAAEEFMIQVTEAGDDLQVSVYWLKNTDGSAEIWHGSAEVFQGQDEVSIELFDFIETGEVEDMFRGNLNLFWQSCHEVATEFESYPDQQSTTRTLEKSSGNIEGLSCD